MSYQFKGNLKGLLCDKYCIEAIANVKIRLYRAAVSREVILQATAAEKETFHEVSAEEAKKKGLENPVTWNFGKYLINEKGELIATFSPKTQPMSDDILKYLN